jgi:hypothetical protein
LKQSELADGLDISTRQVRKLVARGMPTDSLKAALAWRSANLEPTQRKGSRIDGNPGVARAEEPAELDRKKEEQGTEEEQQLDLDGSDADELFRNARAIKEKELALQARADRELFVGELVRRSDVENAAFIAARVLRDGLMSLAQSLSPELAAITDPEKCEKLLDAEFRQFLDAMDKEFEGKLKA